MTRFSDIARRWQSELEAGGYERRITTSAEFRRLLRLSRTWRTILKATRLRPGAAVFEFGCGGGNQLIPLALHGYRCAGIDCSEYVLARFRRLMADAERFSGRRDRKSTRLNSSHLGISYAVFCLKKKNE